jgi:hypothetical protein
VRHVYRRYVELGSVRALKEELDRGGVVSKRRVDRFGRETGGKPLARGALYLMLQNRIYRGEIVHKEQSYPGQHAAIIDEELWDNAQALLTANRVERKIGARATEPSLLASLIYDDAGERMTPTHANKKGTRYRYYVSQNLIKRGRPEGVDAGRRIPAGDVEALVADRLTGFLRDEAAIFGAIESFTEDVNERKRIADRAADLAERWPGLPPSAKRAVLQRLVDRIDVQRETIEIALRSAAIPVVVNPSFDPMNSDPADGEGESIILSIPARLKRAGMETKLLIEGAGGGPRREPDRSMLRLLAQAHRYREMLLTAQGKTMLELAKEAGVGRPYFCRVVRLGFLAPQLARAILRGRHPLELTAKRLSLHTRLPNEWQDQMTRLGTA